MSRWFLKTVDVRFRSVFVFLAVRSRGGFAETRKASSTSVKTGAFVDQLSDYHVLKNNSAPWSWCGSYRNGQEATAIAECNLRCQSRGFQLLLGCCQPEHCLAPSIGHRVNKPNGGIFLPVSTVATLRSLLEFASSTVAQLVNNFPPFMETGGSLSCLKDLVMGPYPKPI
jgi:hypothetical protein